MPWEDFDILDMLHKERDALGLSTKVFMKAMRYAITGMKVGVLHPYTKLHNL